MKMFYIDPQSYSNLALYDYNLLKNLPHETEIIFCGSFLYNQPIPKNVKFIPVFRYNKLQNNLLKLFSYWASLVRLFLLVSKKKPNVVHIQWIRCFFLDYLFLKLLKCKGIKVVYTAHNVLPHNSGNKYKNQFDKYYHRLDAIIVHFLASKNEIVDLFNIDETKVHVIRHGILSYPFSSKVIQERATILKETVGLNKGQIVFAMLGAMSPYKGCDFLVDVWKNNVVLQDSNKYKLLIVGKNQGIDFAALQGLENVYVLDALVDDMDFLSYLSLADVLLLPYRKISQSGVLLTAIAQHIPFVVSNAGGISEPLSVADVGWNIGEASYDNLQKCLLELIAKPEEIKFKKEDSGSWEKIQKLYSWENIASETFCLYTLLM